MIHFIDMNEIVSTICRMRRNHSNAGTIPPPEAGEAEQDQGSAKLRVRRPAAEDARDIWNLVRQSDALDENSPYAYLLLCSDFADCSLVAERGDEIAGFIVGYRPPRKPQTLFVWQIGVAPAERGRGVGTHMLAALVERGLSEGARYLEATVTPSNGASRALFVSFARKLAARCHEGVAFSSDLFPSCSHEEEIRIRIGPISPASRDEALAASTPQ